MTCVCLSGGKKCLFFGKFNVLCFLVTPVLRFAPPFCLIANDMNIILYQKIWKLNAWQQKQMFAYVFQNERSEEFRNIYRKIPVLESLQACNFIKKRLQHRRFPVNIANFSRIPFFIEHLRWLFL